MMECVAEWKGLILRGELKMDQECIQCYSNIP